MTKIRTEPIKHDDNECPSPMRRGLSDIEFESGCMWERYPWQLSFDNVVREEEDTAPCPHCVDQHIHLHTRYDKSTYEYVVWICPRVVVAYNEGACNTTGMCLDCILAAAQSIKSNKGE